MQRKSQPVAERPQPADDSVLLLTYAPLEQLKGIRTAFLDEFPDRFEFDQVTIDPWTSVNSYWENGTVRVQQGMIDKFQDEEAALSYWIAWNLSSSEMEYSEDTIGLNDAKAMDLNSALGHGFEQSLKALEGLDDLPVTQKRIRQLRAWEKVKTPEESFRESFERYLKYAERFEKLDNAPDLLSLYSQAPESLEPGQSLDDLVDLLCRPRPDDVMSNLLKENQDLNELGRELNTFDSRFADREEPLLHYQVHKRLETEQARGRFTGEDLADRLVELAREGKMLKHPAPVTYAFLKIEEPAELHIDFREDGFLVGDQFVTREE